MIPTFHSRARRPSEARIDLDTALHARPIGNVLISDSTAGPVGQLLRPFPGNPGGSPDRARKALNAETIAELHRAFRIGGRQAINKVMRNQPAVFLKLLVLLVPREMKVEHSNPIKDMTTEQIERSIEFIKEMIAKRDAAANAKVIEGEAEVVPSLPAPGSG